MKKLLSLCINLLLFIISEARDLKLIAGDRTVVKKDGATHTISKYYVVPNDFNPNNVTTNTETSRTTLRMNHSLYSKSMDADKPRQHQVGEKRAEAANNQTNQKNAGVNNNEVRPHSDLTDVQVVQDDDNTAESTGSVNTEQNLGPDDLGSLQVQVEPIANFTNVNSSVTTNEVNVYNSSNALQNGTLLTVENTTETLKKNVDDKLEDFIHTKFIAVQESSLQNLESFWKLIKLNRDKISDDDEFLTIIKKLSLLLHIFTNLYEAAQSQKPVESMVDNIIDILQTPFVKVKKINTDESQSQTDVTADYDEECLRKCGQKRSRPQLDSNGTYLSETESQEVSDKLELKILELQRRQKGNSDDGNDWANTSNDPVTNQVADNKELSNSIRSRLLVLNKLNGGVSDGFNYRSSTSTPTLNHDARENGVQEDPKSKQTIPDSADIDKHLDGQPLTMKTRLTDNIMPWTIEDKLTKNIDDQPLTINNNNNKINLPWHIEDKTTNHQPWNIKHRTTNTLPWTIVDRETKKLHWKVKNRADPNWTIENKMGYSPKTLYQSRYPSVITHGGKILLHPNQPMTGTVHSVKHGVKKPYHIYTYVINPETSLYEIPNSGNFVKVKSRQPNANSKTRLYGLSTSRGGNKILYANQPSPSYYESQFSLLKPSVDISSQTNNTQLKYTNHVTSTYGTSNEVNPSGLLSETTQDDNQPKYLVGHEPETNHKAALLQPKTLPSDSQTNSDHENKVPQVPEVGSHPGVLLLNVPSTSFQSLINLGNTEPVSPVSADTSDANPDIGNTEPKPYNPNTNLNRIHQTNLHPGVISKDSYYSDYTNLPDDYDKSSPLYGRETHKHPGLISTDSSSSAYTNLPHDYDESSPFYGGETHKQPGLISTASSSSAYTNYLPHDYDDQSPVYSGKIHKHPSLISTASSSSAYTNLPDDCDEPSPVNGAETHKHPSLISTASSSSAYTNLPDDYDKPSPVSGGVTHKHPGLISTASSSSTYTNLLDEYHEPVYGGQTHEYPGFTSKASSHSEYYTNLPNEYNNPTSDYEEDTDRYPVQIQTPVNGRPTKIEDNLLVSYHPYGHKGRVVQPSLIAHHGNQPTGPNYLKHLKLKLAPTYRMFTLDNLLKLYDAIIKTIKANGDKPDVYNNQVLVNLRKIINIILLLAKDLEEPEGSIEWYEKIFYNTQRENRHPLEIYVYNLIRQRWLHELILVLYNNNFNFNILQNPRIFSFLDSWQFPNYVLNFMETEELLQHKFDASELFDQIFSSQYGLKDKFATHTYDDVLEEVPENLKNYVTNNVIESYKTPNAGIVLSIAGVEAEPDANAIIHILLKYLHYKSFIEKQENVIIRDNKVEMLKQIILFLKEKGYDAVTIADLIRKLYTALISTEGKGCQTHHTNFAKNMYDVILPVLRRSGR